jgi:hypothetical protein
MCSCAPRLLTSSQSSVSSAAPPSLRVPAGSLSRSLALTMWERQGLKREVRGRKPPGGGSDQILEKRSPACVRACRVDQSNSPHIARTIERPLPRCHRFSRCRRSGTEKPDLGRAPACSAARESSSTKRRRRSWGDAMPFSDQGRRRGLQGVGRLVRASRRIDVGFPERRTRRTVLPSPLRRDHFGEGGDCMPRLR